MESGTLRLHPLLSLHLSEFLLPGYNCRFCILTPKSAGSLNVDLPLHATLPDPTNSKPEPSEGLEGNVLGPASSWLGLVDAPTPKSEGNGKTKFPTWATIKNLYQEAVVPGASE